MIQGKVYKKEDTKQISDSFRKRIVIIHKPNPKDKKYDDYIQVEFIQGRCELLDGFNEGDEVQIEYNVKGRKWVNNSGEPCFFVSLNGWKIKGVGGELKDDDIPF